MNFSKHDTYYACVMVVAVLSVSMVLGIVMYYATHLLHKILS